MSGLDVDQIYAVCNGCYGLNNKRDAIPEPFEVEEAVEEVALEKRVTCNAANMKKIGQQWSQPVNFCNFWTMA